MAIELVTGHSGAAHVSGADAGAMQAGICGSDSYVLGAVPSVTMSDANTLVIQPCDLMIEGRHVRLSGTNTLSIRSGAQTGKRNDLVYVRYTYDASTGTESAKLGVKEGTTATTATDPALDNPSSVLDGATIADVAIARVSLDALTPTATWLLPQLPTLKALGDSVSQITTDMDKYEHDIYRGTDGYVKLEVTAHIATLSWDFYKATDLKWDIGTLDGPYRPSEIYTAPSVVYLNSNGSPIDHVGGYMCVYKNGDVSFRTSYSTKDTRQCGCMTWPTN